MRLTRYLRRWQFLIKLGIFILLLVFFLVTTMLVNSTLSSESNYDKLRSTHDPDIESTGDDSRPTEKKLAEDWKPVPWKETPEVKLLRENLEKRLRKLPAGETEEDANKRGMATHGYNARLADTLPLNRHINDMRHPMCRRMGYPRDLPKASIIICFHNEALSSLLRSVHSILNNSPPELLEEIILVDDASHRETHPDTFEQLDEYVSHFSNVKVLRQDARKGLIRARLAGAAYSQGKMMNLSMLLLLLLLFICSAVAKLSKVEEKQISGLKNLISNLEGIYPTCSMVLFSEMVDFNTANERCKRFHLGREVEGNLATVNNKDKNTDLKLLLKMAYPTSSGKWAADEWVWAGLRKIKNNAGSSKGKKYNADDWAWADETTPQDFHMWMAGQPDQDMRKVEKVKYFQNQMRINHKGKWDDTFVDKIHPYACDYQGKYIMSATKKSWSKAKEACENAGLILAKVRSSQEVEEITSAAKLFLGAVDDTLRVFDPNNWIWLGGNDADEEDVWKWNDGDAIEWFADMPWREPNPDNSDRMNGGRTQNFLSISKWGEFDDSFDAQERKRPFACQCPGT